MHEDAVVGREELANILCATYDLKGYDYSPLEKVKIDEILDKLKDIKKRQENVIRQLKVSRPFPCSSFNTFVAHAPLLFFF